MSSGQGMPSFLSYPGKFPDAVCDEPSSHLLRAVRPTFLERTPFLQRTTVISGGSECSFPVLTSSVLSHLLIIEEFLKNLLMSLSLARL